MNEEMEEAQNECAFCENPVVNSDETVMVISAYRTVFNGTDKGIMEPIKDDIPRVAHEDCWEGRNGFAPARRRVLHIGGI